MRNKFLFIKVFLSFFYVHRKVENYKVKFLVYFSLFVSLYYIENRRNSNEEIASYWFSILSRVLDTLTIFYSVSRMFKFDFAFLLSAVKSQK